VGFLKIKMTSICLRLRHLKLCLLRILLQLHFGVVAHRFLLLQQVAQQKSQQKSTCVMGKGSDTQESFLSKVAFESNLRKKLSRIEHVLILKVSFKEEKMRKFS